MFFILNFSLFAYIGSISHIGVILLINKGIDSDGFTLYVFCCKCFSDTVCASRKYFIKA